MVDTRDVSDERLGINFTTERPISADDLSAAFKGISNLYKRTLAKVADTTGLDSLEFSLYITKIESKCILTELAGWTGSALSVIPVMDQVLILDQFQKRARDILWWFAGRQDIVSPDAPPPTLMEAKDVIKMMKAAGDGGFSMERRHYQSGSDYSVVDTFEFRPAEVRAAEEGAERFIAENTESESADRLQVALYLTRLDKNHHGSAGSSPERGIIESISKRSLPVHWISELDSKMVKSQGENLFSLVFTVDVKVDTVRNSPHAYRVLKIHGWEPMDDNPDLND